MTKSRFSARFGFSALALALGLGAVAGAAASTLSYTAENARLSGGASIEQGVITHLGGSGTNSATLSVRVPGGGLYRLDISYLLDGSRNLDIGVNGAAQTTLALTGTSRDQAGIGTLDVTLKPGINSIRLGNATGAAPDIARVVITSSAIGPSVAPYQDVSLGYNEWTQVQAAGLKHITFAFVEAESSSKCTAYWGGLGSVAGDGTLGGYVTSIRGNGGDVIFSFGGASGYELADACTSVSALQAQYQEVVTKYKAVRLDFDIEYDSGDSIDNETSINRRNQAIAALEKANPDLSVTYTLPVDPTGLEANALYVLTSAKKYGVTLHGVNVMAMDFGSPVSPTNNGNDAVSAAKATLAQLSANGISATVGIIVLPGKEDDYTSSYKDEFTIANAETVESYAAANKSQISLLSFWELSRDQECPGGGGGDDENTCSSIAQTPYQFSKIFEEY